MKFKASLVLRAFSVLVAMIPLVGFLAKFASEKVTAQINSETEVVVLGNIVDVQNKPLPNVAIQAISETGVVAQTASDGGGSFHLVLRPGTYVLRALLDEKIIADAKFATAAGKTNSVDLKVGAFFHGKKSNTRSGGPEPEPRSQTVRIFYATDREKDPIRASYGQTYGPNRNRDGSLYYGVAFVNIPRDHRIGELEDATFWSFSSSPDGVLSLSRIRPQSESSFFEDVHTAVEVSDSKCALVFIHGYNVSFEDAARRTAQMTYDLGFDGASILYSWPSKGRARDYAADEESIQWTANHLRIFLEQVARKSGAQRIQIIAHSMGNRALLNALSELSGVHSTIRFKEIVLAAPDIDAGVFRQIASAAASEAGRITLYASSTDRALNLSRHFHQFPRAGEAGTNIVVVPSIDTVDATTADTSFLGHSYFAENRSILGDLFELLRYDLPPRSRFGLEQQLWNQQIYWKFKP